MKARFHVLTMLLLFCCAALLAQTPRTTVIVKETDTKKCVTTITDNDSDNHHFYGANAFTYYSNDRDPCKVFIGVGTSSEGEGLRVDYTVDDTPAEKYGVQEGDIILALDGVPVKTQPELVRERDKHQQGEAFTLSIVRGGQKMTINARFKECTKEELEQARKQEEGLRPILGIYPAEGEQVQGLSISEIIEGKGASKAGLQSGDVITIVDGKTITGVGTLKTTLSGHKPGEVVQVVYLRDGQTLSTRVTLSGDRAYFMHTEQRDPCAVFIGVYTSDPGANGQGVRVTGIIDGTPAKQSDVRSGDVILSLDGAPVNTYTELRRERDKHQPGDKFRLTVIRDGATMDIDATFKACPKTGATPDPVEDVTPLPPAQNRLQNPASTLAVESLDLYPNPTAGPITVRFEAEAVPTTVRIMDATGKEVYSKTLPRFNGYFDEGIDLWGKTPGTYTLTVQQGNKILSRNFILLSKA